MRVIPADIPEVHVIEPDVYHRCAWILRRDLSRRPLCRARHVRGRSCRTTTRDRCTPRFVDSICRSPGRRAKLIRVIVGEIFDVAVDVRRGSPTFGKWVGVTLSAESFRQYYIPRGFAHGFSVLSPVAEIEYKCTDLYDPAGQIGLAWNDPSLNIPWGVSSPMLSDRDRANPTIRDADDLLPRYERNRTVIPRTISCHGRRALDAKCS